MKNQKKINYNFLENLQSPVEIEELTEVEASVIRGGLSVKVETNKTLGVGVEVSPLDYQSDLRGVDGILNLGGL